MKSTRVIHLYKPETVLGTRCGAPHIPLLQHPTNKEKFNICDDCLVSFANDVKEPAV